MTSKKWIIEVEVHEGGYTEATLFFDGAPIEGHSDSTNSLTVQTLMAPLVRSVAIRAQDARRRATYV